MCSFIIQLEKMVGQQQKAGQLELTIIGVFSSPAIPNEVHVSVVGQGEFNPLTLPLNPIDYGITALKEGNKIIARFDKAHKVAQIEAIYSGQKKVYSAPHAQSQS